MPSVLPGLTDRKTAEGWMSEVLYFNPKPKRIAWVFGDTLEELRERKQAVVHAMATAILGADRCVCIVCHPMPDATPTEAEEGDDEPR